MVIGIGNRDRGDDAVGPVVCDLVAGRPGIRTLVLEGSTVDLPMRWEADDRVVIVDASAPVDEPGRVQVIDGLESRLAAPSSLSTHAIDVGAAIELGRALGRLPAELWVVAVEAAHGAHGAQLSERVAEAARSIARDLTTGARPGALISPRAGRRAART